MQITDRQFPQRSVRRGIERTQSFDRSRKSEKTTFNFLYSAFRRFNIIEYHGKDARTESPQGQRCFSAELRAIEKKRYGSFVFERGHEEHQRIEKVLDRIGIVVALVGRKKLVELILECGNKAIGYERIYASPELGHSFLRAVPGNMTDGVGDPVGVPTMKLHGERDGRRRGDLFILRQSGKGKKRKNDRKDRREREASRSGHGRSEARIGETGIRRYRLLRLGVLPADPALFGLWPGVCRGFGSLDRRLQILFRSSFGRRFPDAYTGWITGCRRHIGVVEAG